MSNRWVCKRCFANNEEQDAACGQCGLIRGAESTVADQDSWKAGAGATPEHAKPGWRRWLRFWWIPALAIALVVGYVTSAQRGDDGALTSAGSISVDDLRVGDCFNTATDDEIADVDAVPCNVAHEYEVFTLATYEGSGSYPSDSALPSIFAEVCQPAFEPYVAAPYDSSEIYGSMISPSAESWDAGDRSFICVLFDPDDAALTESLAGAGR
ncbi:MAG: septum formation family protein [Candidatus Limnocylindria bacterium]